MSIINIQYDYQRMNNWNKLDCLIKDTKPTHNYYIEVTNKTEKQRNQNESINS